MSRFLPFEKLSYRTYLSEKEITEALQASIEPKKLMGLKTLEYKKPFLGWVHENHFELEPCTVSRNPLEVNIKGTIQDLGNERLVTLSIKWEDFTIVLWFFMWITLLLIFIGLGINSILDASFDGRIFIPLVISVIIYGYGLIFFYGESERNQDILTKILALKTDA